MGCGKKGKKKKKVFEANRFPKSIPSLFPIAVRSSAMLSIVHVACTGWCSESQNETDTLTLTRRLASFTV